MCNLLLLFLILSFIISNTVCILSGSPCVSSESFNHIVLIGNRNQANIKFCTGSLLTQSWIISSASCFITDRNEIIKPYNIYVQTGTFKKLHLPGTLTNYIIKFIERSKRQIENDFIDGIEIQKIDKNIYKTIKLGTSTIKPHSINLETENPLNIQKDNLNITNLSADRNKIQNENISKFYTNVILNKQKNDQIKEMNKYVRKALQVRICPYFDLKSDISYKCNLILIQVDKPFRRFSRSWFPLGNGPIPKEPFKTYLSGWGVTRRNESGMQKNFILDVEILPPQHCPPSQQESKGIYCIMTENIGHPCIGDEGLPLMVNFGRLRRLIGVGHGSEPIIVYKKKKRNSENIGNQLLTCGQKDRFYVFTNLCFHKTWIFNTIPGYSRKQHYCD